MNIIVVPSLDLYGEGRRGYSFEVNGLLGYLLRALGFDVTDFMARVLYEETKIPMRRHRMLLLREKRRVNF